MDNLAEQRKTNETMTDEEIEEIRNRLFDKHIHKYSPEELENMSSEELKKIRSFIKYIPNDTSTIDLFVRLDIATREELEEENKKLIRERAWENVW